MSGASITYYGMGVWRSTDQRPGTACDPQRSSTSWRTRSSSWGSNPDEDPPRLLAIGPDDSGNLLEVIWLELAGARRLVIHAMKLRPAFYALRPPGETT